MDSLLIFLLDESQSMAYFVQPTLDAYNKFLRTMQCREDACDYFMAAFSTKGMGGMVKENGVDPRRHINHRFTSLFDAGELEYGRNTYQPDGGTALYNAIGFTLQDVDAKLASLPDNEKPVKITFVIQTDGDDRHSGWLNAGDVRAWLDEKRQAGWDILFLAAGGSAAATGRALGFTSKTMLTYDISGQSTEAFDKAADAVLEALVTGKLEV